ncbi:hypothetical protein, partial [Zhongshania sp.]|uniref:hypothetical protein n=1 Tax=Zhongshania sp. TaxID=1971902 RepID=UPI003564DB35
DAEIAAIMAENQALLDLAGPDNGTVYWDISSQGIADKYTLSGGFSEVATYSSLGGTDAGIFSSKSHSAGKKYFEIVPLFGASTTDAALHLGVGELGLNTGVQGLHATSPAEYFLLYRANGQLFEQGNYLGAFTNYQDNDVIGVSVDFDARIIQLYVNGTLVRTEGFPSGLTLLPLMYAENGGNGQRSELRLRAGNFTQAIPSGYEAWGADVTISPYGEIGGDLNGAAINEYAVNHDALRNPPEAGARYFFCRIFADKELKFSTTDFGRAVRLPSGFLARIWEVEINSDMVISQAAMATTAAELMEF